MSESVRGLLQRWTFLSFLLFLTVTAWNGAADAARLSVSWTDNSTNEDGFKIERRTGAAGTFTQVTMLGANLSSYSDSSLAAGVTYCYRVRAFNVVGDSVYSDESCGSTTVASFTLTAAKAGNGSGTVSSSPGGIACGADCSEPYPGGTTVTLSASPASGSTFTGWSGGGCSGTGPCAVTLTADTAVTATFFSGVIFAVNTGGPQYVYTDGTTYKADTLFTGGATATTMAEIAGTTNDLLYQSERYGNFSYNIPMANGNYVVILKFAELYWSAVGKRVFDVQIEGQEVISNLDLFTKVGKHTAYKVEVPASVTDGVLNINFRADIDKATVSAIKVSTAGGTSAGSLSVGTATATMKASTSVKANTSASASSRRTGVKIGVFRPSTGEWYLDLNGNEEMDDCQGDNCLEPFGQPGSLPVVGDWIGKGAPSIGVFDPSTGLWQLDLNGNGKLDSCQVDSCLSPFGLSGDLPIVGDWTGTGTAKIGIFDPNTGLWELDLDGDGRWDGCEVDGCLGPFGQKGDLPVVGEW